jgi:hypothetical protein
MKKVYSDTTLNYNIKSRFSKPPGEIAVTFDCSDANIIGDTHDDPSDESDGDWE